MIATAGCSSDSNGVKSATTVQTATLEHPATLNESLTLSSVVELTQLEQINTSLQKGPILLKIGAEWCGPCQEMKPILKELATEYGGKATIMYLDVDKSVDLSDYFVVSSIPDSSVIVGIENGAYIYMQEDGNVTKDRFKARILGLRDKEEFEKVLNLALQNK